MQPQPIDFTRKQIDVEARLFGAQSRLVKSVGDFNQVAR